MPYGEYAKCPCCEKTVYGRDHIGKIIPQSYLKKCCFAGCKYYMILAPCLSNHQGMSILSYRHEIINQMLSISTFLKPIPSMLEVLPLDFYSNR